MSPNWSLPLTPEGILRIGSSPLLTHIRCQLVFSLGSTEVSSAFPISFLKEGTNSSLLQVYPDMFVYFSDTYSQVNVY